MSFWKKLFGAEELPKAGIAKKGSNQPATASGPRPPSIHDAATSGDLGKVKALLKGNPDLIDKSGMTPLHWAASRGHKDVAELLLANKADVNARNTGPTRLNIGMTPLHYAAGSGHKAVVELLVANGADVNARSGRVTPLHLAARDGHKNVAELLLANKADVNARDNTGDTPLHYAAWMNQPDAKAGTWEAVVE